MRIFFKTYQGYPILNVLNVVLNIAWLAGFIYLCATGMIPGGDMMRIGRIIIWYLGVLAIMGITSSIHNFFESKKKHAYDENITSDEDFRIR